MEMIELDKITIENEYLRTKTDIDALMKSIETVGLIAPLVVNKDYKLLAGGRRYSALKELGRTKVPVTVIDKKDELTQELISIDENLVRKALSKLELEKSMARGKVIYEKLNPTAPKIEVAPLELTPSEKKLAKEEEQRDVSSFAAVTAMKTGLSKGAIKKAIQRDVLSSNKVKEARGEGIISASQTNELVKLKNEEQDEILPYIAHRSAKDVKNIVDSVKKNGVKKAIETVLTYQQPPKELSQLQKLSKTASKLLAKINGEEIFYEGNEKEDILRDVFKMREGLEDFIRLQTGGDISNGHIPLETLENSNRLQQ